MAGHQRHFVQLSYVPCAHDNAAAVGVGLQGFDDISNLVDMAAIWRGPTAPLHAVHRAQVARLGIRPLVPNAHAALFEPVVVGGTGQKPQQLLNDGAQVHLLGRHQWKAFVQIEAHLVAKHALGAGAGAVGLVHTGGVHMAHEVFVLGACGAVSVHVLFCGDQNPESK